MAVLIGLALVIWGWLGPFNFTVTVTDNSSATAWIERSQTGKFSGFPPRSITVPLRFPNNAGVGLCRMFTGHNWSELQLLGQIEVAVHEVGHCFGLDHVDELSVMTGDANKMTSRPTAADLARLAALRPGMTSRRSLVVPMVGAD